MINRKIFWDRFTDRFESTIFHPQYLIKKYTFQVFKIHKKYFKGKLLDIGCGRMRYKDTLKPLLTEYVGLDHPKISKLYTGGKYQVDIFADAKKIPAKNNTFDTIMMFHVLEYLPDPKVVFREIKRILKPKGYLIIISPFMYPLHDIGYDLARYSDVYLKKLIKESGLTTVKIESHGTFLEFWVLSLIVFLFIKVKKMNIIAMSISLILLIPIYLFINLIAIFILKIFTLSPKKHNIFPLEYLAIAKNQSGEEE